MKMPVSSLALLAVGALLLCACPTFAANPFGGDDQAPVTVTPSGSSAATSVEVAPTPVPAPAKKRVLPPEEKPPLDGDRQALIDYYIRVGKGNAGAAWDQAYMDRMKYNVRDLQLRDVEHYWWARSEVADAKFVPYTAFQEFVCTLGYSAYKVGRQAAHATVEAVTGRADLIEDNTTKPTWKEVGFGLKGIGDGLKERWQKSRSS